MKLPPNGGLNLSVLDGWWCEGYNGNNGWAIGAEIKDGSVEFQSEVDAGSLYQLLENQIIPLYYAKPDGKLPLAWLQLMRESIRSVTPVFNTHRMVKEYTERLYIPAAKAHEEFARDNGSAASELSQWKAQMRKGLAAGAHRRCASRQMPIGKIFPSVNPCRLRAKVHLGAVDPEHVRVEAYHGETENGGMRNPAVTVLIKAIARKARVIIFIRALCPPQKAALYGFSVRVVPTHPHLMQTHELRLITWCPSVSTHPQPRSRSHSTIVPVKFGTMENSLSKRPAGHRRCRLDLEKDTIANSFLSCADNTNAVRPSLSLAARPRSRYRCAMTVRLFLSVVVAGLLVSAAMAQPSPAPSTSSAPPMEFDQFILVLLVRPPNAPEIPKPELDQLQEQHLANINRLHAEGKLLKAGPTEDQSGRNVRGIFILTTDSFDKAREWVGTDPLIKRGRLVAEYLKWYVEKGSLK